MTLLRDEIETPLGVAVVIVGDDGLVLLDWLDCPERIEENLSKLAAAAPPEAASDPGGVSSRVRAYFEGELTALDELAVAPVGTAFQQRVWRALRDIPAGSTSTYGELADKLDCPGGSRAVGLANGRNPISLVLPCHRVVGADGNLRGYAGGLERKKWLLHHERARLRARKAAPPVSDQQLTLL